MPCQDSILPQLWMTGSFSICVQSKGQDSSGNERECSNVGGVQLQQVTFTDQWTTTLGLNGRQMIFKIDTGAEVTVIPASSYNPVKGCFQLHHTYCPRIMFRRSC